MFKMLYNEVLITAWIVFVFKFQRNNWLKIGDWQHVFFGCIDQFNLRLFEADPDSTSLCVTELDRIIPHCLCDSLLLMIHYHSVSATVSFGLGYHTSFALGMSLLSALAKLCPPFDPLPL